MGIGKTAEQQVGFPYAPMPGAEQEPPLPLVQTFARSCRTGHLARPKNAESPDGPGARI